MKDNEYTTHIIWAIVSTAALIATNLVTQRSTSTGISQKTAAEFMKVAVAHHAAHYEVDDNGVVSFVWNDEIKK